MKALTILSCAALALSSLYCGSETTEETEDVVEPVKENDNDALYGIWEREYSSGKAQYVFEEPARFQKKTFEAGSLSAGTCSQGFYLAKEGNLTLYSRGGNGGWNIEIQPYVVDGEKFILEEVYQNPAGETKAGEWRTYKDKYQVLSEEVSENPCEVPGQQATAESLCCPEALEGISVPANDGTWPLITKTKGILVLNTDGTSQFDWSKTDSDGNIYIDRKSGAAEISAAGNWVEEADSGEFTVSDDSANKRYKIVSPTTIYEDSSSYIFNRL